MNWYSCTLMLTTHKAEEMHFYQFKSFRIQDLSTRILFTTTPFPQFLHSFRTQSQKASTRICVKKTSNLETYEQCSAIIKLKTKMYMNYLKHPMQSRIVSREYFVAGISTVWQGNGMTLWRINNLGQFPRLGLIGHINKTFLLI